MTEKIIETLSSEEMVAWANAALERERELRKEIVKLKALLFRHRRALNTIHGIVSDMQDKVKERGPVTLEDG